MDANTDELCYVPFTGFDVALGEDPFPHQAGRYWLFTTKLCPFAHRAEIVRQARGLGSSIGLTVGDAVQTEKGWNLRAPYEGHGSVSCPLPDVTRVPQLYQMARPGYDGRCSVPVLFDLETGTIVNTESAQIIRQLDHAPDADPATRPLYPISQQEAIDGFTDWLEEAFITPIYQAGFARDQATHDACATQVFQALDALEKRLSDQSFMIGETPTLADVHAFVHLARFDSVFYQLYRLNGRYVGDYEYLPGYMTQVGQLEGFSSTLDIAEIKRGYFLSWNQPTNGAFVPRGPDVDPATGVKLS